MEVVSTTVVNITDLINLSKDIAQLNLGYLGISVTILAILGGVFYLFQLKPLKDILNKQGETISDLKKEAGELLKSAEKKVDVALENFDKEQKEKLSNSLQQNQEKLLLEVKNQLTLLEKTITEKTESTTENKDNKLKEIILSETDNRLRALEDKLNSKIEKIERAVSSIDGKIKDLKRKTRELEVFKYSKEGKMGAIYGLIDLLKEDIEEKSWRTSNTLEQLENEITGIILKGDDITIIEEQLVKLDEEKKYKHLIDGIREQYQKKGSQNNRD
jgi:hypothetical protein